jgi:hypothetical protein
MCLAMLFLTTFFVLDFIHSRVFKKVLKPLKITTFRMVDHAFSSGKTINRREDKLSSRRKQVQFMINAKPFPYQHFTLIKKYVLSLINEKSENVLNTNILLAE